METTILTTGRTPADLDERKMAQILLDDLDPESGPSAHFFGLIDRHGMRAWNVLHLMCFVTELDSRGLSDTDLYRLMRAAIHHRDDEQFENLIFKISDIVLGPEHTARERKRLQI